MPGKIVNAIVPELGRVGVVVDRLLGILVAAIVAQPNIETHFNKGEREATLRVGQADPNLGVHEQTMVEVDDRLARRDAHTAALLPVLHTQSMQSQQIAVLGLYDMLLE